MDSQTTGLQELSAFMEGQGIGYAVIGGLAVQIWGEPRFTLDIDVTVLVNMPQEEQFVRTVLSHFTPRVSDPLEFALEHRVVLIKSASGCNIDLTLGLPGYEEGMIERARLIELESGASVRICTPEDLVILKAVAGRAKDWQDIEGIVIRQADQLDYDVIETMLKDFEQLLECSGLVDHFKQIKEGIFP